jgi:RNA-directed DNA polymerase
MVRPESWIRLAGESPVPVGTGIKFRQIDWYVVGRLRGLMVKKRGRNLRPDQADQWTEPWFNDHGLHRLRGTIRYPKAA